MPDDFLSTFNSLMETAVKNAQQAVPPSPQVQDLHRRIGQATQMAQQHGIDSSFGLRVGQSNAAFARAWGNTSQGLGFGGIGSNQAGRLDQELRLAAAQSPMANAMGALHAMQEAGIIQDAKSFMKDSEGRTMMPAQIMSKLRSEGVDMRVAGQFMASTKANMEQVAKHNLQDEVRGMQQQEMSQVLGRQLANTLVGGLRHSGMDRGSARAMAQQDSAKIMAKLHSLANTDPSILNDQGRLLDELAGQDIGSSREQLAGALQGLRNRVMSDANLKKFGNLQGALAMNAGAVDKAEDAANMGDDAGNVERGPAVPGPVANQQAGERAAQGGTRISGTLTILENGQAQLEGQAQGAAPGGD